MGAHQQILYASERSAARMLDMRPSEFRALVDAGALPGPVRIGDMEWWSVSDLDTILRGYKPSSPEEFSL